MSALTVFFLLFAVAYVNGLLLDRYLQRSHRGLWIELGEPTLSQSNLGAPRLRLMKLVWSLGFLKMHDGKLNLICFASILLEFGMLVSATWLWVDK